MCRDKTNNYAHNIENCTDKYSQLNIGLNDFKII